MERIIVVCPAYRSQLRLEELRFADVLNMVAPFTLHKRRSGGQTIATRWINLGDYCRLIRSFLRSGKPTIEIFTERSSRGPPAYILDSNAKERIPTAKRPPSTLSEKSRNSAHSDSIDPETRSRLWDLTMVAGIVQYQSLRCCLV